MSAVREYSSFRDPAGMVFRRDGVLLRQVNRVYEKQYRVLMDSGLYAALIKEGLLIKHTETEGAFETPEGFALLKPAPVPLISYPYEWSFGQLRDAAVATLRIHRMAMDHGMILKDASAYNIQFVRGRAVLIDTLSFDFYTDGAPWIAYGQFCRHFLAPLLLMCEKDVRMNRLLASFIDGIPIDLADVLLGNAGGMLAKQHIHWHAKAIKKHDEDGSSDKTVSKAKSVSISRFAHISMIESMQRGIEKLALKNISTEWADYYAHTNYSAEAGDSKKELVRRFLIELAPKSVWDVGANDGTYSHLAFEANPDAFVAALDYDGVAVERNWQAVKKSGENLLPLIYDVTNPAPAIGFGNEERQTLIHRQRPDCVMALAVIHHIAISNNLPLSYVARWFSTLSDNLIIEFVPKGDSQVNTLLKTRDDIFPDYSEEGFEKAFMVYFEIRQKENVAGSLRTLYRMTRRAHE